MSLRMKLFGAFFTLIIVPLAVLGAALHVLITGLMEDKFAQQTELTLRALAQNIGFLFAEMNKVTDSTIASDAIQDLLDSGSRVDLDAQNYMKLNEVQKKFRELLVNHPSVSNALLYTLDDGRINRIFAKEHFEAMPFGELQEHPLFHEVLAYDGVPYWIGPYEYPELTGSEPTFTQIRVVKDIDTLTNKGILLVQIKPSGLEAVFRYFRFRQEQYATRYLVVSGQGTVLFDSGGRYNGLSFGDYAEGGTLRDDGEPVADRGPAGFYSDRMRFDEQDSIVSRIGLGLEDWQLVAITSREAVSSEAGQYAGWTAAVVWFCLLLALLFLLFFANRVAKSIIGTVQFMRRVERGDLTARLPVTGNDETALLARGFNSLVHRITELLEEVKAQQARKTEAEWEALQAQIKPHFLFNTLESINGLAAQNQGRKVSQMVARLGNLLRISIQQKAEITVEQELEHLISYLDIQQYRFEGLFDYEIDIPPEFMHCSMLKLTLQPLVENCIQHGFEGIDRGFIRVSAREESGGRIAFLVEDNGIGIPRDRLAALGWAGAGDGAGYGAEVGAGTGAEARAGSEARSAFGMVSGKTLLPAGEEGSVPVRGELDFGRLKRGEPDHGETDGVDWTARAADRGEQRGLGVANVAERIRIRYGPKYGLMLCTDVDAGTVVKMTIPKYEGEDRSETNETERAVGG